MFDRISYTLGVVTGYILRGLVYGALVWGIWRAVVLREIPYLPVILWVVYSTFARILFMSNVLIIALRRNDGLTEEDVSILINRTIYKNSIGMGPN